MISTGVGRTTASQPNAAGVGKAPVRKAVVLAGSVGTAGMSLANYRPTLAFELANRPLFDYQLEALAGAGIEQLAVVSASHHDALERLVGERAEHFEGRLEAHFVRELTPQGTAGALRALGDFLGESPFLVLTSHLVPRPSDLEQLLAAYAERAPVATVAVEEAPEDASLLERVRVDADGRIEQIVTYHSSRYGGLEQTMAEAAERRLQSSGLYVFESAVLDHLHERGYMDIKEQLLPRLRSRGLAAIAVELEQPTRKLISLRSYFDLNRESVAELAARKGVEFGDAQVVVAPGAWIDSTAQLSGPIVLAPGSSIGEGARVQGPVSLGRGARIAARAKVRDSVLSAGAVVGRRGRVTESFVDTGCQVCTHKKMKRRIIIDPCQIRGRLTLIQTSLDPGFKYKFCGGFARRVRLWRETAFHVSKRALDVVGAALLLALTAPLFGVVALAIRRESAGPVWYSQRRCGKDGRKFAMHKFRSMVANAEELHTGLIARKDVDGPMFKMHNDPRVTKVGRFLRKTSLDELPQLVNVLRGEMSLVGPRPLIMEEMELAPAWRDLRLRVKPGITGLWQVNGRDSVGFHDWIANDIRYVKEQSLWLDLKILLQTLRVLRVEKPSGQSSAANRGVRSKGRAEALLR